MGKIIGGFSMMVGKNKNLPNVRMGRCVYIEKCKDCWTYYYYDKENKKVVCNSILTTIDRIVQHLYHVGVIYKTDERYHALLDLSEFGKTMASKDCAENFIESMKKIMEYKYGKNC